ncbi:MAG: protein kinase, partial [Planctomycetales bacterium]|nr:protein kinase [Planctomycetales bacterium]
FSHEDVARLRFESQVAASLDHSNIVPIFDSGELCGRYYIAMKMISGGSLRELSRSSQSVEVTRLAAVSAAVQHAHDRGILHRDLKPSNVLVDEHGVPFVSDFGLAKLLDSDGDLTRSGVRLGTPRYMSPEQSTGAKSLTVASDIYSLGIILYERVVGERWAETSAEALGDQSRRLLDARRLQALTKTCDRRLQTIIRKCLETLPQDRYASCRDLERDLECWLRGEPISTQPTGGIQRGLRWLWRHPQHALAGACLTMAALLFVWLFIDNLNTRSHGRVTEYAKNLEHARAEILAHRPGWKARGTAALDRAEAISRLEGQTTDLESLRVGTQIGLDVGLPHYSVALENTRVVRFHPSKPWLLIAQKHASEVNGPATILIVESATGNHLHELAVDDANTDAENGVTDITFTPDGRWMLVVSRASNLLIYDSDLPAATAPDDQIGLGDFALMRVVALRSGYVVVVGRAHGGSSRLWTLSTTDWSIAVTRDFPDGLADIEAADDLNSVILSEAGRVQIANPATLETTGFIPEVPHGSLAYRDGWLAIYHQDGVHLVDVVTGHSIGSLAPPPSGFPTTRWDSPIAFSESGELLAVADNQRNQVHFWSTTDLAYVQSTAVIDSQFNNICFDFSADSLLAASAGGHTAVNQLQATALRPILHESGVLRDVALARDRHSLVTLRETQRQVGRVEAYRLVGEALQRDSDFTLAGLPDYHQPHIDISSDGSQIAVLSHEPRFVARILQYSRDGTHLAIRGPLAGFRNMAFAPDQHLLASSTPSLVGWTSQVDETPWQWARRLPSENARSAAKFSFILPIRHDRAILGDEVGSLVALRYGASTAVEFQVSLGEAPIRAAAFHTPASLLAVGDGKGDLYVLDINARPLQPVRMEAHWSGITCLAWTACGHLISAGLDQTIRYWQVDNAAQLPRCVLQFPLRSDARKLFPDLENNANNPTHDLVLFREGTYALERLEVERRLLSP